jgi:octanoyl-[GcvH]:protein N-octanoyltransferase
LSGDPAPLYTESPADAALDVAISHALLNDAARAGIEALRVWVPPAAVSFGRLDLLRPDIDAAIVAARAQGLEPVRRLAGGRAAAIGAGTVCVGWASPSPEMARMQERYETLAGVVVAALERLGVPSRIGELDGEWCPGSWSVLVGSGKVGGLAQRVIKGGAWAEAVIVVSGTHTLGPALDRVQRALGVSWRPETLAQVSDASPAVTPERMREALIDVLPTRRPVRSAELTGAVWARARELREQHAL